MQRRVHPSYARHTAQISFGLVAGGLASLVGGVIAKEFGLRELGTILNVAFGACAVVLAIRWFHVGETTTCPVCGSALTADKNRTRRLGLTFRCRPCDILWLTQPEPGAQETSEDEDIATDSRALDDPNYDPDADGYNGEELDENDEPLTPTTRDQSPRIQ